MTLHRTVRDIAAAAPPDAAATLLADFSRWPEVFGPVVHADHVADDGDERLVRVWVRRDGRLDEWVMRCLVGGLPHSIAIGPVVGRPPAASVRGVWRFDADGPGRCRIELAWEFEAIADDPDAVRWLDRTLGGLAEACLDALRGAAERETANPWLRFTFGEVLRVDGPAEAAYEFFARADRWPVRLAHLATAELAEDRPGVQRLELRVREPDGTLRLESEDRVCFPERGLIAHKRLRPDPPLLGHLGRLAVTPGANGGATASWQHVVVLDPAARGPRAALVAAADKARRLVSANSLLVLREAKRIAEGG